MGTAVLISGSSEESLRFFSTEEGWIVLLGLLFDIRAPESDNILQHVLDSILHEDKANFNSYEGTFALAAWDRRNRTGWVWNDQASCMNCYYAEDDDGLYATTSALALARSSRRRLDPRGVCELFSRGTVLAPTTIFSGMRRLNLGEHVRYREGECEVHKHWVPYKPKAAFRGIDEAASALASGLVDRIGRYASLRHPVVVDLTGGYDSRLVASATHFAGKMTAITVDGSEEHEDVRIAKRVAAAMNWPTRHFNIETFWSKPITPEMRRDLTYRTSGELPFTEVYHHLLSRPILAQRYSLHFTGGGGELLRSFPWAQEFFGIGRLKPANVRNALAYRFFQEGPPPDGLFRKDWYASLLKHFEADIESIFQEGEDALTTQQLDAAYLWRMTGFSHYTSSLFSWLPTTAPLMCASLIDTAIAMPWRLRLTTRLMRTITDMLAPGAAEISTHYGGTCAPVRISTAHKHLWQLLKQAGHFLSKIDRVHFNGFISNMLSPDRSRPTIHRPFLTEEFRAFLRPEEMLSRNLYSPAGLTRVVQGDDAEWHSRERILLRMATVEQLCRELNFEPEAGFLFDW
jgi:hypothetical protein